MNLKFRTDTSTQKDILSHLQKCDKDFIDYLNNRVNIEEYSTKLYTKAKRFEAWDKKSLVGLIAIYINQDIAYISNVSVAKEYTNNNIASNLIRKCIDFTQKENIKIIKLEVQKQNISAIKLYERFNFKTCESNETSIYMEYKLNNNRGDNV